MSVGRHGHAEYFDRTCTTCVLGDPRETVNASGQQGAAVDVMKPQDIVATPKRWHWSGHLCHYVNGKLIEQMEHGEVRSDPSPPVVLWEDYEALRAELEEARRERDEARGVLNKGAEERIAMWASSLIEMRQRAESAEAALRWIPCSERLPEAGTAVIVYAQYGPNPEFETELADRNRDGVWRLIGEDWSINVTHWMPLPEPPRDHTQK